MMTELHKTGYYRFTDPELRFIADSIFIRQNVYPSFDLNKPFRSEIANNRTTTNTYKFILY